MHGTVTASIAGLLLLSSAISVGERPSGSADCSMASEVAASKAAQETWVPKDGVTPRMKAAADSFLIMLFGRETYRTLVFDPLRTDQVAPLTRKRGFPHRGLFYWLVVPNDPDVATRLTVGVTPEGMIAHTIGVPDCRVNPRECVFLTREAAFEAAAAAGLAPGVVPWRWSFSWNSEHGYFYEIRTILERQGYWDVGELMRLDASDGRVFWRAPTSNRWTTAWEDDTPN